MFLDFIASLLPLAFFGLFGTLAFFSAMGVAFLRSSIHSVLALVFLLVNISCLFLLLKAEFMAMLMLMVYVGAVTVLFLFFVMMIAERKEEKSPPILYGKTIYLMFGLFILTMGLTIFCKTYPHTSTTQHDVKMIGAVLYTDFLPIFQTCGLILLMAIVGSIALLHNSKDETNVARKQNYSEQMSASYHVNLRMVKIGFKEGVEDE